MELKRVIPLYEVTHNCTTKRLSIKKVYDSGNITPHTANTVTRSRDTITVIAIIIEVEAEIDTIDKRLYKKQERNSENQQRHHARHYHRNRHHHHHHRHSFTRSII
ncbi:hypothetical protein GQX74_004243 [Glossina fuscipes]|nr:hypothetical protein GQX74_004243 [Glossina fuscipes]